MTAHYASFLDCSTQRLVSKHDNVSRNGVCFIVQMFHELVVNSPFVFVLVFFSI